MHSKDCKDVSGEIFLWKDIYAKLKNKTKQNKTKVEDKQRTKMESKVSYTEQEDVYARQ